MGDENPIVQIHDHGAGGNCNVVKEIAYPKGGKVDIRNVKLGDETMSVLEIWGAEYQENDAILIKPEAKDLLQSICDRERSNLQVRRPRRPGPRVDEYRSSDTYESTPSSHPVVTQ